MFKLRAAVFPFVFGSLLMGFSMSAMALDLDWHGQLRAETNWLWGYSNGNLKPNDTLDHGYSVYLNGDTPASFQNLFFDLSPRVIVNDNVSIKSDLWLGTPDTGMFGSDQGFTSYYFTSHTGNATIVANTFYAEMATDFGTITVGRAPLNWGLGVIWNYDASRFYRMPSTGDMIKMTTKLGAFRFSPAVVKYRRGTNYGGSTSGNGTIQGSSGVSDYSVALQYANEDDQMDLGVLFLRRLAGPNSIVTTPYISTGYAYNVWDFYARKNAGAFTLAAEVPLVTGSVGGQDYSTVAGAAKVDIKLSEKWKTKFNFGMANGQGNTSTVNGTKLTAFYFHPDYRPGLVMFNYNLQNLSDGVKSPYDNPVTNATFFSAAIDYASGKWSHELLGLFASADKTADGVSAFYFNNNSHTYQANAAGAAQEKGLGFEIDYSLGYEWDEAMQLGLNMGLYFPGNYYKFANDAVNTNNLSTIFGSSVNVRVMF
ncbi:MAG: hypothetical protein JST80_09360 [Bdellovibrionales bacterium]|nr:hypothetical protein [Bdellovibrionales bacterium]